MRHRRPRHSRGLVTRTAIGAVAGLAVVASSATGALAEDTAPTDEVDPSTILQDTEPSGDAAGQPDAEEGTQDPASGEESTAGESTAGEGTDGESAGEVTGAEAKDQAEESGDEAAAAVVDVVPDFGSQKIRIGVQQADGSYISPDATLVGTTMSISITGGVDDGGDPLPDSTAECVVTSESGGATFREAGCNVGDADYLELEPGQSATITPTVVPEGIVLAPESQVVEPCLVGTCVPFPNSLGVFFEASGTPAAISATTVEGQAVVIDVVDPLELAPDNAVTEVTVTSQSPNGTATVTGDLPPVTKEPVGPTEPIVALKATTPVTAAAPSGSSRIVFTPNAGFVGTTTFGYAVATQNGTLTGVATITVTAAPVVTPPVVTPPTIPVGGGTIGTSAPRRAADGTLPSTGGPAEELLGLGALLVLAGAGAMAARRRQGGELVG